jgi:phosphate transport system substrate-binding protein
LTRRDVYLALAREIPDPEEPGRFIRNPNVTWRQVNAELPAEKIEVLGPVSSTTTYRAFQQLVIEEGCVLDPWAQALKNTDLPRYIEVCRTLREYPAYVETGDSDSTIARRLGSHPGALAVLNYNTSQLPGVKLAVSPLEGVAPTYETLATRTYGASRVLYLYAKTAQSELAPQMARFVRDYSREEIIGPNGILASKGFVPLSDNDRASKRR